MTSTEQLEREAELSRAQLAASLDELRSITPGRVIDEIFGYAKSGSAELIRGLGNQIVEHPLPATLIGAGIAWLIMQNGSSSGNGSMRGSWEGARTSGSNWFPDTARSASSSAQGLGDRAGSAISGMRDTAQSAMASVGDTIDSTTGAVKERAQAAITGLGNTASGIGDSISDAYGAVTDGVNWTANTVAQAANSITPSQEEIMQAGQRVWDYCKEQPLVVAGIALALGAALGAAIPETEAENRLMGETADDLKDKAQNIAAEPLDAANRVMRSVGEHVLDEATKFAKQEISDLVGGLGSRDQSLSSPQLDENGGGDQGQTQGQSQGQSGFGDRRPYH